jgi:hypothetical protein
MVLNAHFCMGDFAGVSIVEKDIEDQCPKCGMEDMGCCHDVPQVLKIDNADFTATHLSQPDLTPVILDHFEFASLPKGIANQSLHSLMNTCVDSGPPIYIMNCVFRI